MEPQPNPSQSNEQPYHPKHHIKVYVWIALVVASLLVAANGYLYFLRLSYLEQGARTAQENEQMVNELRAQRSHSMGSGQFEVPSNWQTYRNEEYGFEFKYPGDHTPYSDINQKNETIIQATSKSGVVKIAENEKQVFCCEPLTLSVEVRDGKTDNLDGLVNQEFIKPDNSYRVTKKGYEDFLGQNSYRVYVTLGIDSPRNIIAFNYGEKTFLIRYDSSEFLNQILSTFKFTR